MLLYTTRKWDVCTQYPPQCKCPLVWHVTTLSREFKDYQTVYDFGKGLDVLTIEIEHVNTEALRQLEKEGVQTYPSAATLELIQNKGVQKDFYQQHHIPTAPHQRFENKQLLQQAIDSHKLSFPLVEGRPYGYDGQGVSIIRSQADMDRLQTGNALPRSWCPLPTNWRLLSPAILRAKQLPILWLPEFHPEANQVEYVLCPARIAEDIKEKATAVALQVSKALNHVGLLAVELFLTEAGEILVNEVAPRPHNSGHHTIETVHTDQFEQHIRAILNLPLGSTRPVIAG